MAFRVIDCAQRSPEWVQARLGRLTGSVAADMLAERRSGGEAAGRKNLRARLVLERLTGKPQESDYQSAAMRQGIEREPDALLAYEAATGQIVTRTGFLQDEDRLVGCSLDGHIGDVEWIVEAKSPMPATHLEYLRSGIVPSEYAKQILHNLWVTVARGCAFVSFNPHFPPPLHLQIVQVPRDDAAIAAYAQRATAFLAEVDRDLEALRTLADVAGTLHAAVGASA